MTDVCGAHNRSAHRADGHAARADRSAVLLPCRAFNPAIRLIMLGIRSALTFDMRGGRQQAKPDVGRPLDGRVRAHWISHGRKTRRANQTPKSAMADQAVDVAAL